MNNIFNTKCSKGSVKAELIKTENSFRQVLVGIIVNENYKISYLLPVKKFDFKKFTSFIDNYLLWKNRLDVVLKHSHGWLC